MVKISGAFYDHDYKKLTHEKAMGKLIGHNGEVVIKEDLGLGEAKSNSLMPKM